MPAIGAELVDLPLTAEQAGWRLETASGQAITLGQLPTDRLVFLNFWATWCPPCREELPSMLRLQSEMRGRAFMMVAVGYDETWEQVREFFAQWRGAMPGPDQLVLLRDPQQEEGTTLRERFGTTKLPDTYVLYGGRIVARFVNARNWADPSIMSYFRQLAPPLDAAAR
ncbi:MAG: TlpA family protein disulfide reductase [Deltaproteobacteria bacterium]|nr:TlpA family protein disulfide reductase [Deltaproteobacteria bacterium]